VSFFGSFKNPQILGNSGDFHQTLIFATGNQGSVWQFPKAMFIPVQIVRPHIYNPQIFAAVVKFVSVNMIANL